MKSFKWGFDHTAEDICWLFTHILGMAVREHSHSGLGQFCSQAFLLPKC